ncbi:MAG: methionine synthase, partial [Phycicoccus sp.]
AGVLPTDGSGSPVAARRAVVDGLDRAGLGVDALANLVVTPACGLAALTPARAQDVSRQALDTARRLTEETDR